VCACPTRLQIHCSSIRSFVASRIKTLIFIKTRYFLVLVWLVVVLFTSLSVISLPFIFDRILYRSIENGRWCSGFLNLFLCHRIMSQKQKFWISCIKFIQLIIIKMIFDKIILLTQTIFYDTQQSKYHRFGWLRKQCRFFSRICRYTSVLLRWETWHSTIKCSNGAPLDYLRLHFCSKITT
jgi:hypothetical protein